MKRSLLLSVIALLQCVVYALAAASDAKIERLSKLAKSNQGVVKLNSNTYSQFTEGKRNYGMVVLLTALDDMFKCVPCR